MRPDPASSYLARQQEVIPCSGCFASSRQAVWVRPGFGIAAHPQLVAASQRCHIRCTAGQPAV